MRGRPLFALVLLLAVAVFLRFHRIDYDLPEVKYVDSFKFVGEAARMVEAGSLKPAHFQYPGLYVSILAGLYQVVPNASEAGRHLLASLVAAAFGVGLVAATAGLARQVVSGTTGLLVATALAALSIVGVSYSRIPAADALSAFFSTAALAILAARPTRLLPYAGAGIAIGLAAGAKLSGLIVLPLALYTSVAAGRATDSRTFAFRALGLTAATAGLVFLATTPWIFTMWTEYSERFLLEVQLQRSGQIGRIQRGYLDYLFSRTPTWEMPWLGTSLLTDPGAAALAFAFFGAVLAFSGRANFAAGLCAWTVVVTLVSISGPGRLKAIRFLIPALPAVYALAGLAFERLGARGPARARAAIGLVLASAVLAQPALSAWSYVAALGRPSTNALARDWVREKVPPASRVLLGPFFTDDLRPLLANETSLRRVGARQYRHTARPEDNPELNPVYSGALVDKCRQGGIEYVVLNSYFDGGLSRCPDNERWFPESVRAYEEFTTRIGREADKVFAVDGRSAGRFGPSIAIYRLRAN